MLCQGTKKTRLIKLDKMEVEIGRELYIYIWKNIWAFYQLVIGLDTNRTISVSRYTPPGLCVFHSHYRSIVKVEP